MLVCKTARPRTQREKVETPATITYPQHDPTESYRKFHETVPRKKPQKFNIRSSCNKCGRWVYYPSPANREPGILNFSKLSLYRCTATNVARDDSGIIGDTMFIAAARFTPGFLLQALTLLCLQGSVWFPRVYSLSSTFPLALVPSACLPHIHRKLFPYALVISRSSTGFSTR